MRYNSASMDEYQRALDYLYGFINFEQKPLDRYQASKLDVSRPRRLLALLGSPQDRWPAIHIAGTKGKGSVAAMCAASLRAAGLRVGLYTSPHLREFRERVRVLTPDDPDGRIPEASFVHMMVRVRVAVEQVPDTTWFEIVTALAFLYFADAGVDVGVIEVGLGGRLDATNVLMPVVSAITSLSLDHTQLLGDTLSEIAAEKGGIIKPGVPVIVAPQKPEALQTLEAIAAERSAPLVAVGRDWLFDIEGQAIITRGGRAAGFIPSGTRFTIGLAGSHQLENGAVALAVLEQANNRFPMLDVAAIQAGLATVQWDGRLQLLQSGDDGPTVLVDCAHNEDSASRLRDAVMADYRGRRLVLVFGAPADKNIAAMLDVLVPIADVVVTTTSNHPRSATPDWLAEQVALRGREAIRTRSVPEALDTALASAQPGDLVLAAGSIIVIGDLLNHWDSLQSHTI